MLLRLEMGLKFGRLFVSRSGFLSNVVTNADLKHDRKQPYAKNNLASCGIRWKNTPEQETIKDAGVSYIGKDLGMLWSEKRPRG